MALRGARTGAFLLLAGPALAAGRGFTEDPCASLREAKAAVEAGDLRAAQLSLESCVAGHPASAEAWRALGLVRFARQQLDEAATALETSVRLDARQPQAFKLLGRVQTARSQPALAERAFVEAARLDDRDAEARYLLGRLYQSQDRLVEAARFLGEAAALDPASVRAHAFLGTVRYALGDTSLAEESFRRAIASNRASRKPEAVPHLEYGVYLQRTNRLEESVTELRRAAELDRSSVDARFELGRSLYRLRRPGEAREALEQALSLDASDPRVHYLLGRVCYDLGDRACGDEHTRLSETHRGP